jgi:DNA-binding transcriptional LysR family regulator
VDALEGRLGAKLFQRHARGYTPTEAGRDLLQVAGATEDQLAQLVGRIRGHGDGVSGDLVVTSLVMVSRILTGVLVEFQNQNPGIVVRYLTGERLFRLEYGEAHVAVRAGLEAPSQPDNVVQLLMRLRMTLVASDAYVTAYGMPGEADLAQARFVGLDETEGRAPYNGWLAAFAPRAQVTYRVRDDASHLDAVVAGAGLGFVPAPVAAARADLHEVVEPREEWAIPIWIVTHVDLHRTPKVQAFLHLLKERAKSWSC